MKNIIFILFLYVFSNVVIALENFDECGELYISLKKKVHEISLDDPYIPVEKGLGIFIKDDLTKSIPYEKRVLKRTKENNILLESMLPQIYEAKRIDANAVIFEVNNKKVEN